MEEGLVIVSTLGNEMSTLLSADGIGLHSAIGDKNAFVNNVLSLIDDNSYWKELSDKGIQYLSKEKFENRQFDPLYNWLKKPCKLKTSTHYITY